MNLARFIAVAALVVATLAPISARKTLDLDSATIADLNAAFNAGTLTAEKLTDMCLARIEAYDRKGPALRAMIAVNPKALETARALDAERKSKGPRSPLHGIPVILKDNYDTADMATTGGSLLLEGSIPPDDAFVVKKLRDAGAVIIGKANLSEFASGAAHSSLGGQMLNPHDRLRTPSGSSGGTGIAIAAAYGVIGLGTDTGGSIRARDFLGQDPDVDWVIEAALDAMRRQGATMVDVRYPRWVLDAKGEFYSAIRYPEFVAQIAQYLATIGPKYPKNIDQLLERAAQVYGLRGDGAGPNPSRWGLMKREAGSGTVEEYRYTSVRDHGLPLIRSVVEGIFASQKLDAIVYPTASRRPGLIAAPPDVPGGGAASGSNLANLTGFPDLIVPAGFTGDDLPVGISFFGPSFSEPKLLALGYAFEQVTRARRLPIHTPKLPGETITLP
jgi:Asp-tRNA(Asn)/Glu-tRNA(Gln) amidotransferase A subunit family amidase